MKNNLVVSALGEDRPGLVNELSRAILECDCNIMDSRMTVLGREFGILLLVQGNWNTLTKLEMQFKRLEQALNMTILTKRTESRTPAGDVLPYAVEVVAVNQPGIVHHLANFFASRSINIEDMVTRSYSAPHTGTPMFSVNLAIGIPASMHIAMLREEFLDFCDDLNLDAVLEPIKG
ncbi:MAG: glycine cleavage system protein R [Candidatus Competibacteraceae bacterium]|nr:glycine cleavage system protein R [Candidatus Competibacteraceae bacterium]MBK7982635.1 glycine cleavage system protein R [Candidatus Competibacteraceae bacterium]MBK8898819.1 glycine cleavage system protein R [Candidatus Competibacteraceae bacterium]MBK8962616.1 glycine cleavage system protein R [Candidatus Competibacteraceae bacterium]MBK9951832.1 glycine cleavage system protein R [Candidatus Competibacteraceae bacterium]